MTETQRRPANPRIAWFETTDAQTDRDRPAPDVVLPPPDTVQASRGRGQVTVRWTPVEGAAGYLVCGHGAAKCAGHLNWPLADREPHMLETVRPGVFAAGDVRADASKRVAGAVGDGAMVVRFAHEVLAG